MSLGRAILRVWRGTYGIYGGFLSRVGSTFPLYLVIIFCVTASAWATLGQSLDPFSAGRPLREQKRCSVSESEQGSAKLREYVTRDGRVFAVAWNGVTQPDLRPILGDRFNDYSRSISRIPRRMARSAGRRIRGSDFVVESFGHMRAMRGRAYIPRLLPSGFTPDEIR
ncbi:MAG: DUF2844 domain-containing protein [Deltaproteobacteria bacterium]|nr:DUF2844 domain-containing protein [Deltaproteobacteria bacterium]MBI3295055.1 DUF2844 domain-containing protein [Deltaproteobacteria bacterium]